jgi:hypothetical protein
MGATEVFQEFRQSTMTIMEQEREARLRAAFDAVDFEGIQSAVKKGADPIADVLGSPGMFVTEIVKYAC